MSEHAMATDGQSRNPVDCWNRIGVRGDGSCPELEHQVHCRNCPVHARAAAMLLDADLPQGHELEWAHRFAGEHDESLAGTESVLVFRIAREWLALPTAVFAEVVAMRPVHSLLSRRAGALHGLVNVRGELLLCLSLGKLLGIEGDERPRAGTGGDAVGRLLVMRGEEGRIVFPVAEVAGIVRFRPGQLRAVPETVAGAVASHTRAILPWDGRMVGCLDERRVHQAFTRSLS